MPDLVFVHSRHRRKHFGILRSEAASGLFLREKRVGGLHLEGGLHVCQSLRGDGALVDQLADEAGDEHEQRFARGGLNFIHFASSSALAVESIRPAKERGDA